MISCVIYLDTIQGIFAAVKKLKNMRIKLLSISTLAVIVSVVMGSCSSADEKVQEAEVQLEVANDDLEKANAELESELAKYREDIQLQISSNQQKIADYGIKIKQYKNDVQLELKEKMLELEQKNMEMKNRLDNFKSEGNENWIQFKEEFNRDMSELGKSIDKLTVK
jgi:hypothetical protein